jgi:cytoskeleton protein RodZ
MSESIGQQLRQARQQRRISLEQAAQATHIRLHYLEALEAGQFTTLSSAVQLRGFLRAYAQYLGLPEQPLLAELDGKSLPPEVPTDSPVESPAGEPLADGKHSPKVIFDNLGAQLRRQRELLGLSLEEVERQTHVRLHYLRALENGRLDELPSTVQGRGMLSNYASFLGMNVEELLMRYADGLQARLASRQRTENASAPPVRTSKPSSFRRAFSGDLLVGGFLVLFLVGFVAWAALRVSQIQSDQQPSPTAPSVAEVLAMDTATPTLSPTPAATAEPGLEETPGSEDTPGPLTVAEETTPTLEATPTFPVLEGSQIQLYLVARERAWVQVIVDGEVELEGRVVPGSAYLFNGTERVELVTGNGAALQVFLNRQDLGPLGIFGEVVQRVFTLEGMQTATPAVPPTSTPSLTPTMTVTGTLPTPTPSQTPTSEP